MESLDLGILIVFIGILGLGLFAIGSGIWMAIVIVNYDLWVYPVGFIFIGIFATTSSSLMLIRIIPEISKRQTLTEVSSH